MVTVKLNLGKIPCSFGHMPTLLVDVPTPESLPRAQRLPPHSLRVVDEPPLRACGRSTALLPTGPMWATLKLPRAPHRKPRERSGKDP